MQFKERVVVPVDQATAWHFVWQTERVAACMPGCRRVETVEPGQRYRAHMQDSVGPATIRVALDVTVLEQREPDYVRIDARGQDPTTGVKQVSSMTLRLVPLDAANTALDIDANVEISGGLAMLGGFMVKRKAQEIIAGFARNIQTAIRAGEATR